MNNVHQSPELVKLISNQIKLETVSNMRFMEVCGGHTHSIKKFGIPDILPSEIKLVSGPGCPVCVTNYSYIDNSIELAGNPDHIICSYGDLIRVPGNSTSLEKELAVGKDIRIVLSSLDAVEIAVQKPKKQVIFLGIGFETTTPSSAAAIQEAAKRKLKNFSVYSAHKIMPPAMKALSNSPLNLDGFICPGHVSTIAGANMYSFLPEEHSLACVVSGFEPVDLMQTILMLVRQVNSKNPRVEIQYKRAVKQGGNKTALSIMNKVFIKKDDWWRGLGTIPNSGLAISGKYEEFDASERFKLEESEAIEPKACSCGEILRGEKEPTDCKLFSKSCTPENPVGACMVSPEGACNAAFRYRS